MTLRYRVWYVGDFCSSLCGAFPTLHHTCLLLAHLNLPSDRLLVIDMQRHKYLSDYEAVDLAEDEPDDQAAAHGQDLELPFAMEGWPCP